MSEFLAPFETMLVALFPPERVRAIDAGVDWQEELETIERSGFLDALLAENKGGAGLLAGDAIPLWIAIGRAAAPLEIGRMMIARSSIEHAAADGLLLAAAMTGAAERVLAMTVDYAQARVQFGKAIGRQQVVQQQLALMAEQALAMRFAVTLSATGECWPSAEQIAVAKCISAAYAPVVANAAHAIHGAIGISAEYDLQLYTRRLHAWRLEDGGQAPSARALGRSVLSSDKSAIDWMRSTLFS